MQEATVLIQTRIPEDVSKWLRREAQREGLSIAAWLRRWLILQASGKVTLRECKR